MTTDCVFNEETHQGTIGGRIIPSVTGILKAGGFEVYGSSEWHMEKGRAVHLACQYLDEGGLDWSSVSDEILPYLMAYEAFKKDTGFKPTRIEERLFHPTLMFTGQIDREGRLNGNHIVLDFKSGAITPYCGIQLSGYDLLLPTLRMPRERYGLQLMPTGKYSLKQFKDGQDKQIFLSMLAIFNWRRNNNL
jgi:hypothetical protein